MRSKLGSIASLAAFAASGACGIGYYHLSAYVDQAIGNSWSAQLSPSEYALHLAALALGVPGFALLALCLLTLSTSERPKP